MKTEPSAAGNWTVKNGNDTCARYKFASVVNITYTTLIGKVKMKYNVNNKHILILIFIIKFRCTIGKDEIKCNR